MGNKSIFIFLLLSFFTALNGDYIIVSDPNTAVRVLPHDNAYILGTVNKGDSLKVIKKEGDWYHIEFNHLPAWLHSHYVAHPQTDSAAKKEKTSEPSTPESNTAPHRVQDASKPITTKPVDQASQQNYPKKNAEAGSQKKPSEKGQSKQTRAIEPTPLKKDTMATALKRSDTVTIPHSQTATPEGNVVGNKEPGVLNIPLGIIVIILGAGGLIFLVAFAIKKNTRPRKSQLKIKRLHFGMDALIIANAKITISNALTNSSISITDYLTEMGFKVHFYSDLSNAKTYLLHYVPDLVIVDWKLEDNIQSSIASILSDSKATINNVVIFYNVPDLAPTLKKSDTMINAHFFGVTLSDQDISKIVVPLFKVNNKEKRFKESIQATALEGEIQEGNLAEVLQFIGMGKKTGCLFVVDAKGVSYGLIYFEQGHVVYAMSPTKQGVKAVLEMLDLATGHFHFVINKFSPNKNANNSCLEIVVEWTRIHDEAARQKPGAPAKK